MIKMSLPAVCICTPAFFTVSPHQLWDVTWPNLSSEPVEHQSHDRHKWISLDQVKFSSLLTVVVLTRPPGCVQVQPDWLTRRSQPSSSKQGVISHHCWLLTIRTEEEWEKRQVRTFHPSSFLFLQTCQCGPDCPQTLYLQNIWWFCPRCYCF